MRRGKVASILLGEFRSFACLEFRRPGDLILGQPQHIAIALHVIAEQGPWQRKERFANPKRPAERQHRIGHPAGIFVDHEILDAAEQLAGGRVDRSAFDLGRRNQPNVLVVLKLQRKTLAFRLA